jgi:hypothetical protein
MVEVIPNGPDHPDGLQIRRMSELLPTQVSPTKMTLKTLSGVILLIEEKSALVSASESIPS